MNQPYSVRKTHTRPETVPARKTAPRNHPVQTFFVITLLILAGWNLNGQDLHLSNYAPAGMLFNPGLTATNRSDVQAGLQYRSQWARIQQPYTTMGVTGEVKFRQMGFGLYVHQNQAGEASLKTTNLMLTGAYHKPLAQDGVLSLGIGIGRQQKRINPALLTFDNQFTEGSGFDASLPNGEPFLKTQTGSTDFSIGLRWTGNWGSSNKLKSTLGMSISHIHLPDEGFLGAISELPMRSVFHGNIDLKIDDRLTCTPHFLLQKQGVHKELLAGVRLRAALDQKSDLHVGMAFRKTDALVLQTGFETGNKSIWLSYDLNTSGLEKATAGQGAFEVGLYLRFDRKKKKQLVDTDGDGIFDHRDQCPKVPGTPENRGCPETADIMEQDTDKDGVPDELDRCPLEPGLPCFYGCNDRDRDGVLDQDDACPEIFGHPENQGCPVKDRDADKDGVPDSEDYCVFLKGSPKFHGCPDSDDDGVSDIDDKCPYLKGDVQNNGCPAESATTHPISPVTIEFDTDQSYIRPEERMLLMDFVKQAHTSGNLTFIVSGHTDSEGSSAHNYELGLRRAQTVKHFLLQQGLPSDRIRTISYGEHIPKSSNRSETGRARNRRAEVSVLSD